MNVVSIVHFNMESEFDRYMDLSLIIINRPIAIHGHTFLVLYTIKHKTDFFYIVIFITN